MKIVQRLLRAGALVLRLLAALPSVMPNMVQAQFAYWPVSAGGNGHYYEAVASPGIEWDDACKLAAHMGGHLAAISSREENAFVFTLIKTNAALWVQRPSGNLWGPWLGGFQPPGSPEPAGGWSWVTGEPFAYANWKGGSPSNDHGIEDRVHFWGEQMTGGDVWNDRPASNGVNAFVVEYETHPNAARLTIAVRNAEQLQITWPSRTGVPYTVQWSTGFADSTWQTLTDVIGDGGTCLAIDFFSDSPRFYRILSAP